MNLFLRGEVKFELENPPTLEFKVLLPKKEILRDVEPTLTRKTFHGWSGRNVLSAKFVRNKNFSNFSLRSLVHFFPQKSRKVLEEINQQGKFFVKDKFIPRTNFAIANVFSAFSENRMRTQKTSGGNKVWVDTISETFKLSNFQTQFLIFSLPTTRHRSFSTKITNHFSRSANWSFKVLK